MNTKSRGVATIYAVVIQPPAWPLGSGNTTAIVAEREQSMREYFDCEKKYVGDIFKKLELYRVDFDLGETPELAATTMQYKMVEFMSEPAAAIRKYGTLLDSAEEPIRREACCEPAGKIEKIIEVVYDERPE